MAIAVVFDVRGMTAEQYEQSVRELEAAGEGAPRGRLYHVASSQEGGWFVVDVWDSAEDFERFGQTLMPILQAAGVTPPQPQVYPVHNIIKG